MSRTLAFGPRHVSISDSGVEVSTGEVTRCWFDKSLISGVVRDKEGWIIMVAGGVATGIPHQALTAAQAEALAQYATVAEGAQR